MQEQVRNFLERNGGHASSMAIASQVLRLRNTTPATAERVVGALLADKTRFAADGLGNWYLTQTGIPNEQAHATRYCLVFTPMQLRELKTAQRVVLCWRLLRETKLHMCEIGVGNSAPQEGTDHGLKQVAAQEFVQRDLPELQACVLVSWNMSTTLAALRRLTLNHAEAWLPPGRIALQKLARQLLGLSRPPQLALVYEKLVRTKMRSESWEDQMHAHAEIWEALQTRCAERGLSTWEQIAHFAQAPARADFSQFDFEEKMIVDLPETPGVYVMKDREGRVIYVGKSANLRTRVRGYFANAFTEEPKLRHMLKQVARLHYELFDTELEALLREQALIKRLRPALNRQIEVHEATPARFSPTIFLVPLREPAPTASKGRVVLYFLSARKLKRLLINLVRIPRARLRKMLADFVAPEVVAPEVTPTQRTQIEIARRWFQQNRAWISALPLNEAQASEEVETQLLRLLRSPEIFHERVELAQP